MSAEITTWKDRMFNMIRENIHRNGNITPMIVLLHKDSVTGKLESRPFAIDMRMPSGVAASILHAIQMSNPIAYLAFSEAKINIHSLEDSEKFNRELEAVGGLLSSLPSTEDAVVITFETLFDSRIDVYQVIKDDGVAVMSASPIQNINLVGHFDIMSNFLKLPPISDEENLDGK